MTKNNATCTHPIDYDNLTRVAIIDKKTQDYLKGYKKLYCYRDNDTVIYIPAGDYEQAKHRLSILYSLFTKNI